MILCYIFRTSAAITRNRSFGKAISISYSARLRRSNFKLYGMWNAAAGARNAHSARAKCHWHWFPLSLCLRTSKLDKPARLLRPCFWWRSMGQARKCAACVALQLTGCFLQSKSNNESLNRRKGESPLSEIRSSKWWLIAFKPLWILPSFQTGIISFVLAYKLVLYWSLTNYFQIF